MSQRCFWKASVNSTYDTKVVLGVCGSILLKTKCGINSIHGKKKVTFIICLNLPTRASIKFRDRFNNLPLRRMEIVCMYLLIYEHSSGSYESVYMQARLHGRWAPLYRSIFN